MTKLKRTYSLEAKTVEDIERLAVETRRDKSSIIDIAVEVYIHILKNNPLPPAVVGQN